MAIATGSAIALALAAASAGTAYYNTQRTAKRTDQALATSIRHQGEKQRMADGKVNEEVEKLQGSAAEKSRREGLDSYMQSLVANRSKLHEGLDAGFGSKAFQQGSEQAGGAVDQYAGDTAGLMARMDAPGQQRQDEAFGYGKLATDLGLIGREAQGQKFLDDLMVQRASRRNAGLDALSSFLGGAAGSGIGSGATGAGFGVPAQGSGANAFGGFGYGSTWGTGRGLAAAGYGG